MGGCSAPNCSNSTTIGKQLFRFPKDPDHFELSQFEEIARSPAGGKKLKPNAIPTVFDVPDPPSPILMKEVKIKLDYAGKRTRGDHGYARKQLCSETGEPENNEENNKEDYSCRECDRFKAHLEQQYLNNAILQRQVEEMKKKLNKLNKIEKSLQNFLFDDQIRALSLTKRSRRAVWSQNTVQSARRIRAAVGGKEPLSPVPSQNSTYHYFKDPGDISSFRKQLLWWYDECKRELPWRTLAATESDVNKRLYAVWVSEIMLQQTQVVTVIDYYNKWMKRWPTVQDLAAATLEDVNEMWSGLGFYSRGKRLHNGAQKVMSELKGEVPTTAEDLQKFLPGVGRYTAGAVASIGMGQVTGVVDGNVIRVMCRTRAIGADCTSPSVTETLWSLANTLVDPKRAGDFNQSMMELGATVCTPKAPLCLECPIQTHCRAYKQVKIQLDLASERLLGKSTVQSSSVPDIEECGFCSLCLPPGELWDSSLGVMNFPRKPVKKQPRVERTLTCVLDRRGVGGEAEYLIVQRPSTGLLAMMWEFPSLPLEERDFSESKQKEAVLAQVQSVLGGPGSLGALQHIGEVLHIFTHIHQTYVVYRCSLSDPTGVELREGEAPTTRWVTKAVFQQAAVSTAMKKVLKLYESKESHEEECRKSWKRKRDSGSKDRKRKPQKIKVEQETSTGKKQLSLHNFFQRPMKQAIDNGS
ncbi:A/G-specific adenine DNA glycosylase [Acipenser ruthenus]|uniref:Adenine DNA glycosylase n=1 Tax=Acipenser ruthenus TaxID=7906 RepID=A0A444U1I4_ACIRT|nr:A/G-specific adenine DNA glycosylase [Acipenser ruthenus]